MSNIKEYLTGFRVHAGLCPDDRVLWEVSGAEQLADMVHDLSTAMLANSKKWRTVTSSGMTGTFDPQDSEDYELNAVLDLLTPEFEAAQEEGETVYYGSLNFVNGSGAGGDILRKTRQSRYDVWPRPVNVDPDQLTDREWTDLKQELGAEFEKDMKSLLPALLSKTFPKLKLDPGSLNADGKNLSVSFVLVGKGG